ncbi:MAG TPA: hypothetical protein VE714_13025 [Gemmatimonadales bacterium]|jgi:hypothetical protein|nr:hypothetical protein [Gemmatimonadales bacterium]
MLARLTVSLCAAVLSASGLAAQQQLKSSSTLITAAEIERSGVGNAFDAVQRLRPRWFRAREILTLPRDDSSPRMAHIRVYIDDRDQGNVEYLKTIPADQILTLEYVSTNEAGVRYGPSDGPGIVVTFKH